MSLATLCTGCFPSIMMTRVCVCTKQALTLSLPSVYMSNSSYMTVLTYLLLLAVVLCMGQQPGVLDKHYSTTV